MDLITISFIRFSDPISGKITPVVKVNQLSSNRMITNMSVKWCKAKK